MSGKRGDLMRDHRGPVTALCTRVLGLGQRHLLWLMILT